MNEALGLAQELYAICPDVIDQSSEDEATVGRLADSLRQSKIWYFWWDEVFPIGNWDPVEASSTDIEAANPPPQAATPSRWSDLAI